MNPIASTHVTGVPATVMLPDGRKLAYATWGDAEGAPLLALHGTPGSRGLFAITDEVARSLGLRVIALDRWGYGGSDAHPAPTLTAFADDLGVLVAHLGVQRFAVLGVSGGGPYATAVAAKFRGRVTALALAAPVGPIAREADPEVGAFHRFCFGALAASPTGRRLVFGGFRRLLLAWPTFGIRVAMSRVPPADRRTLSSAGVVERFARSFSAGLAPGVAGPSTDLMLFGKPWGIPLANVDAPARLWLGSEDRNVPLSAARRLAARLPTCSVVDLPGEGHLWIALNYATVLRWIASAGRTGQSAD